MAQNSENPFGDESVNPPNLNPADESVYGSPQDSFKKSDPPLPSVEPEDGAPPPMVPQSGNRSYQGPFHKPPAPPHSRDEAPPPKRTVRRRINWGGFFIPILIGGFSVLACTYIWKTKQQIASETQNLSFKTVRVKTTLSCSDGWQELGFILRPGDQVTISAEGQYRNSRGGIIDGNGFEDSGDQKKNLRSYEPLFPHGCLIARTSGRPGEVFHIGKGGVLQTGKGGRLQVRVNDLDLAGNRGVLEVEARTFLNEPPDGIKLRGSRDSSVTPIRR